MPELESNNVCVVPVMVFPFLSEDESCMITS